MMNNKSPNVTKKNMYFVLNGYCDTDTLKNYIFIKIKVVVVVSSIYQIFKKYIRAQ